MGHLESAIGLIRGSISKGHTRQWGGLLGWHLYGCSAGVGCATFGNRGLEVGACPREFLHDGLTDSVIGSLTGSDIHRRLRTLWACDACVVHSAQFDGVGKVNP